MEREYSCDSFIGDTEHLWPTGLTEILHINGPNFRYIGGSEEIVLPNQMLIGSYNKRFVLKNKGNIRIVGIRCYNHGANTLFNIDLNDIKNKIIKWQIDDLDLKTLDLDNKSMIIQYLNDYCKKLVKEDEFAGILYKLYKDENISLEQLCLDTNLSLRQFERKVKRKTSFTPKELLTIIRFDKARIKMLFNKDYLQVMTDLGYYDYSHFSKDFKRFYNITPKQFIDMYTNKFK